MVSIERSVIINRPIEEVFDFVTDIENCPKWFPHIVESGRNTSGPIRRGTTEYEIIFKYYFFVKMKNVSLITDYQKNKKITRKITSTFFPVWRSKFKFETVQGSTKISYTIKWEPVGYYKMLNPILVLIYTIIDLIIPLYFLKNLLESQH